MWSDFEMVWSFWIQIAPTSVLNCWVLICVEQWCKEKADGDFPSRKLHVKLDIFFHQSSKFKALCFQGRKLMTGLDLVLTSVEMHRMKNFFFFSPISILSNINASIHELMNWFLADVIFLLCTFSYKSLAQIIVNHKGP